MVQPETANSDTATFNEAVVSTALYMGTRIDCNPYAHRFLGGHFHSDDAAANKEKKTGGADL